MHVEPRALDKEVHTFGCKVVCYVRPEHRRAWNLDPNITSVDGIYLGRAREKKGAMVLVLGAYKIEDDFTNVLYIEDEYPAEETVVRKGLIKHGYADARTYSEEMIEYERDFMDGGEAMRGKAGRPLGSASADPRATGKDAPLGVGDMRKRMSEAAIEIR